MPDPRQCACKAPLLSPLSPSTSCVPHHPSLGYGQLPRMASIAKPHVTRLCCMQSRRLPPTPPRPPGWSLQQAQVLAAVSFTPTHHHAPNLLPFRTTPCGSCSTTAHRRADGSRRGAWAVPGLPLHAAALRPICVGRHAEMGKQGRARGCQCIRQLCVPFVSGGMRRWAKRDVPRAATACGSSASHLCREACGEAPRGMCPGLPLHPAALRPICVGRHE
eukprot:364452-Chlamydomonas_euryale.AAC.1